MPETTSRPLFTTPDARSIVLFPLMMGEGTVAEGTAEQHAKTAIMGFWCDKSLLKMDCAIIFAAELVDVMVKLGWEYPEMGPGGNLANAVFAVPKFGRLFELWRRDVEWELESKLRETMKHDPLPPLGELREEDAALLAAPYDEIHAQLMELFKRWTHLP